MDTNSSLKQLLQSNSASHAISLMLIIMLSILVNMPYFSESYYPAHDTLTVFQFFSYFFSQLSLAHDIPMWLPSTAFGMPIEPYLLFSFGPFQYMSLAIGYLFNIQNTLNLFSISIIGDTLFLAFGTYLFCRHSMQSRWIPIACVISLLLLVQFDQQIYWNFKILLPIPFSLYFAHRGIESLNPAYLLCSMTVLLCFSFGSLPYVLPVQFYLTLTYSLCLIAPKLTWSDFQVHSFQSLIKQLCEQLKQRNTLLLFLVSLFFFILCALMMHQIQRVMRLEMAYVTGGRNADLSVSMETFLSYGGFTGFEKIKELLTGLPTITSGYRHDFLAFAGLTTVIFAIYSFFSKHKSTSQIALTVTTLIAIAFTVTATGIAHIAYYLPGMNIVRHLAYFITVGKLLLIMLSGFGIRAYLHND